MNRSYNECLDFLSEVFEIPRGEVEDRIPEIIGRLTGGRTTRTGKRIRGLWETLTDEFPYPPETEL